MFHSKIRGSLQILSITQTENKLQLVLVEQSNYLLRFVTSMWQPLQSWFGLCNSKGLVSAGLNLVALRQDQDMLLAYFGAKTMTSFRLRLFQKFWDWDFHFVVSWDWDCAFDLSFQFWDWDWIGCRLDDWDKVLLIGCLRLDFQHWD